MARRTREEAHEEARRLIAQAREERQRLVRAEAREDAPELQRTTERLRIEQQRALDVVEALRDQFDSVLNADEARAQESGG